MITQLNKSHLKQAEMQGNEAQNIRGKAGKKEIQIRENKIIEKTIQTSREKIIGKMPIRQDRIIENQSHRGEMMIKNRQNKKENAKNESMLSEQYIHKKNIIETQSQSGRSMVEMLGVLAIISVLSIGGITGYKYAMNYYQANQIAHEINLMRTDAQVKIAQGAEELVLGNPYDDGNINFNNYETDFDCVYMENENATPDLAFCNAANAYYIEMQNIPEGVCRPLANLIDKMDNEIAFYINGKSVDAEAEKGACNEKSNTLRVIFGADSDSESIKCDDDTNCPPELPVCFNHMCVECETDTNCIEKDTNNPICNKNRHMCEPCPKKSFWNGEKCQEGCRENKHCSEDEYCYKAKGGTSCENEWGNDKDSGSCRKVKNDLNSKIMTVNGKTYYESTVAMNWWSVGRFCDALNKTPVTRADLGCENVSAENYDYCTSEIMNKLKDFVVTEDYWHWLDGYDTCYAYDIDLNTGQLSAPLYNKKNGFNEFALCKNRD